jgi:hypothetical protein
MFVFQLNCCELRRFNEHGLEPLAIGDIGWQQGWQRRTSNRPPQFSRHVVDGHGKKSGNTATTSAFLQPVREEEFTNSISVLELLDQQQVPGTRTFFFFGTSRAK